MEDLFKKFEGLSERAHKSRENVVAKIVEALSKHAAVEEMVFYPEIRERLPDVRDDVLEALEEHHVVKWTLSELESMNSDDERYTAKVTVLTESVRHHVKEEERELFPKVRKALSRTDLADIGEQLVAAKKIAPLASTPEEPRHAPRQRRRHCADRTPRCRRQGCGPRR